MFVELHFIILSLFSYLSLLRYVFWNSFVLGLWLRPFKFFSHHRYSSTEVHTYPLLIWIALSKQVVTLLISLSHFMPRKLSLRVIYILDYCNLS